MRTLILAAFAAVACTVAAPSTANAQDVQAQRLQRRAEMQQRLAERRVERLQRLAERRPELKQRIEQRIAAGKSVRPLARKVMLQRRLKRLKTLRPEMFDRLDLNKDGVLSRDEWRPRIKRKV